MRIGGGVLSVLATAALVVGAFAGDAKAELWDFRSGSGCASDGPCGTLDGTWGNVRTFTGDGVPGTVLEATGWGLTGNSGTTLQSGFLGQYSGGLGVTDRGSSNDGSGSSYQHTVDNSGYNDVVALYFGSALVHPESIRLDAYGDTDISVWVGRVDPGTYAGLTGLSVADLDTLFGFNTPGEHIDNMGGSSDRTAYIGGVTDENGDPLVGNLVLIAAWVDGSDDKFKIKKFTATVVPDEPSGEVPDVVEPASLAAFALGMFGIAGLRRRRQPAV